MKGNKGAWSEIYAFLRLLADGKLDIADENLNAIPNVYYPIIKILRQEKKLRRDYALNGDIEVTDENNKILLKIPIDDFVQKSRQLFKDLKSAKGKSFSFAHIELFLNSIDVYSLTAKNKDKSDIKIVVHDFNTGMNPTFGFSIKSLVGGNSTLFNPGPGTNFIYKILNPAKIKFDVTEFNTVTLKNSKLAVRLNRIEKLGLVLEFSHIQSVTLDLNLKLIDSDLPEILSYMLLYRFKNKITKTADLLEKLNRENPLRYDFSKGHPFYKYKLKNLLVDSALGMTAETVWTGRYDATGGIIIVKESGDLVCYHIYNRNEFEEYLLNTTYFDQPSTSEDKTKPGNPRIATTESKPKDYKYGWVYELNGELFIKLNLQIRFF